jgi:hypothetical protein
LDNIIEKSGNGAVRKSKLMEFYRYTPENYFQL